MSTSQTTKYQNPELRRWVATLTDATDAAQRRMLDVLVLESEAMMDRCGNLCLDGWRCRFVWDEFRQQANVTEAEMVNGLWELYLYGYIEEPMQNFPCDKLILELLPFKVKRDEM